MIKQIRKNSSRKIREKVRRGSVHIQAGLNNTIITITSKKGNVLAWSSAGASGFKGARKGTPFAAQTAATNAAQKAKAEQRLRSALCRIDTHTSHEHLNSSCEKSGNETTPIAYLLVSKVPSV